MKRIQFLLATMTLTCLAAAAVATPYERKDLGFSLDLHGGFFAGNEQDGILLFGSNTTPGLMIVMNSPGLTQAEVQQSAQTGYFEEGVSLTPSGSPQEMKVEGGWAMNVEVTGIFDGAEVQGIMAGYVGNEGQGFAYVAVTTPEQWENLAPAARSTAASLRFQKVDVGPLVQQWDQKVRGRKLTYMNTWGDYSGGGSDQAHYFLCSDGTFAYQGSSNFAFDVSGGFGSSFDRGSSSGTWKLMAQGNQVSLVFQYQNGQSENAELTSDEDGKTFLNGTRYFVVDNDMCY